MKPQLRSAALALAAVQLAFLASGCTPECVDLFDCAEQARKSGQAMTCVASKCTPATGIDAGAGGGGGETGGGAGGGATGGGGGGGEEDAGVDAGTGGGTAVVTATYAGTLNAAQAIPGSTSTNSGVGTFTLLEETDGGIVFGWNITHSIQDDGGISGEFAVGLAGDEGSPWFTLPSASSPVVGMRNLSLVEATNVRSGRVFVAFERGASEIRGQIIPAGNLLLTARLETPTPGATRGGVQFVAPIDGGAVEYTGWWTSDVEATLAHIHQGGAGGTGNPIVTLAIFDGGLAGTFPVIDVITGDTDGGLYVNVHTADAGDGLIRGQVVQH